MNHRHLMSHLRNVVVVLGVLLGCTETERAPKADAGDAEPVDAEVDAVSSASRACMQASDCVIVNACFDCACGVVLRCIPEGETAWPQGFCTGGAVTSCDCVEGACVEIYGPEP